MLAADLAVAAPVRPDPGRLERARAYSLQSAETWSFATVAVAGEMTALSSVVAVTGDYPLRGEVRTSAEPYGADTVEEGIPPPGEAWVDAALLAQLDIDVVLACASDRKTSARRACCATVRIPEPVFSSSVLRC